MQTGSSGNDTLRKYEDELEDETIESEIRRMLGESDDDFSELDGFVADHKDAYSGDLADFAFRTAIQTGKTEYVNVHAENFELNNGEGYSTYLYETDNEEMQEILMDHGALSLGMIMKIVVLQWRR